jgi:hypothetical protein
MNKPIGVERGGECFFARALLAKTEDPCSRHRLDANQTASSIMLCNLDCVVGGLVVDEINVKPLLDKVLKTVVDEAFLIVCSE